MPRSLRFGYGRVSSKDQHLDVQEARLEAVCDRVYLEKGSGTNGTALRQHYIPAILW